jgi:hypothetical protein
MAGLPLQLRTMLPWPVPALLVWSGAWAACALARAQGLGVAWTGTAGLVAGGLLSFAIASRWRRLLAAAGFPLSAVLVAGATHLPSSLWLVAVLPLVALYPLRAWRDAPFFPTPADALAGLESVVTPPPQRVLDAGCGVGHGLRVLRRVWPGACFEGIEWSPPLAWLAGVRCPWARVVRDDMWSVSWAAADLVYLFQRPESMARAWAKARAEMGEGGWLVSLEFPLPEVAPWACLQPPGQRPCWVYRVAPRSAKQRSTARGAGR